MNLNDIKIKDSKQINWNKFNNLVLIYDQLYFY